MGRGPDCQRPPGAAIPSDRNCSCNRLTFVCLTRQPPPCISSPSISPIPSCPYAASCDCRAPCVGSWIATGKRGRNHDESIDIPTQNRPGRVLRRWAPGNERFTFHDLRANAATDVIKRGGRASDLTGHRNEATPARVYDRRKIRLAASRSLGARTLRSRPRGSSLASRSPAMAKRPGSTRAATASSSLCTRLPSMTFKVGRAVRFLSGSVMDCFSLSVVGLQVADLALGNVLHAVSCGHRDVSAGNIKPAFVVAKCDPQKFQKRLPSIGNLNSAPSLNFPMRV